MFRHSRIGILAALCVLAAAPAFPWGMGAHLWIAEQIVVVPPGSDLQWAAFYGGMLPDIDASYYLLNRSSVGLVRDLTHGTGYGYVVQCAGSDPLLLAFAAGWVTHNEVWAADFYAHLANPCVPGAVPGYVIAKSAVLSGLPGAVRGDYIETAIDLLLKRNMDPNLGSRICRAARQRNPRIPGLLVAAYSPPLFRDTLTRAEAVFRDSAISYGNILMFRGSTDKYAAASMLAAETLTTTGRWVPWWVSLSYLERAMSACAPDFLPALRCTVAAIKAQ